MWADFIALTVCAKLGAGHGPRWPDHGFSCSVRASRAFGNSWASLSSLRHRFRLVFRIDTRGNNPELVVANAADAHCVLNNALPEDKWILEVVIDKAMGLGSGAGRVAASY